MKQTVRFERSKAKRPKNADPKWPSPEIHEALGTLSLLLFRPPDEISPGDIMVVLVCDPGPRIIAHSVPHMT
jgi:hypothetical protein